MIAEYMYLSGIWKIDHYNTYGHALIGKFVPKSSTIGTVSLTGSTIANTSADSVYGSNITLSGVSRMIESRNGILLQPGFSNTGGALIFRPGVTAAGSGGSTSAVSKRYYYITDHLGSIRVVLDRQGNVDSWSDYYPFGKEARGSSTVNDPKEGFTGYQYDAESSLNYAGARYYNPEIGRFLSVDPHASSYPSLTSYNYVNNNPLLFVDPTGMDGDYYTNDGKYVGDDGVDDQKVYVLNEDPSQLPTTGSKEAALKNAQKTDLGVTKEEFEKEVATVYAETGGDAEESAGIAGVIQNRVAESGKSITTILETTGINGYNSTEYNNVKGSTSNSNGKLNGARYGVIQALQGKDHSGGSFFWEANKFLDPKSKDYTTSNWFVRSGWGTTNGVSSGIVNYNVVKTAGSTTFMVNNPVYHGTRKYP